MDRPATVPVAPLMAAGPSARAIHVELLAAERLVLLKYSHSPSITEWTDAMDTVLADGVYRTGFGVLLDLRGNRPGPSRMLIAGMLHYLDVHQERFRGARWALVVDSPGAYRMAIAGQNLASDLPLEMAVFQGRTPDRALRWLRRIGATTTSEPILHLA